MQAGGYSLRSKESQPRPKKRRLPSVSPPPGAKKRKGSTWVIEDKEGEQNNDGQSAVNMNALRIDDGPDDPRAQSGGSAQRTSSEQRRSESYATDEFGSQVNEPQEDNDEEEDEREPDDVVDDNQSGDEEAEEEDLKREDEDLEDSREQQAGDQNSQRQNLQPPPQPPRDAPQWPEGQHLRGNFGEAMRAAG